MENINSQISENLKKFREVSLELGLNKNLVQAAGGNTSMKINNSMFIKASGTWLQDSLKKNIFVEVNLKSIQDKISKEIDDNYIDDIISNSELRPSTETSFHALINYKYVLHVHSTATIARAVYLNSKKFLKEKLGNEISYVPYVRPGYPLTKLIKKNINADTQIIILENHGLIVAGDNLEKTYELLINTHKQLDHILNESTPLYEYNNVEIPGYFQKKDNKYSIFRSSDSRLLEIFSKSLYPDHVIFLGPGLPVFKSLDNANRFNLNIIEKKLTPPPFIVIEKLGLFESNQCIEAAREMIDCFVEILLRVDLNNEIKFLSKNQEDELLNWDAEIYRQTIN